MNSCQRQVIRYNWSKGDFKEQRHIEGIGSSKMNLQIDAKWVYPQGNPWLHSIWQNRFSRIICNIISFLQLTELYNSSKPVKDWDNLDGWNRHSGFCFSSCKVSHFFPLLSSSSLIYPTQKNRYMRFLSEFLLKDFWQLTSLLFPPKQ